MKTIVITGVGKENSLGFKVAELFLKDNWKVVAIRHPHVKTVYNQKINNLTLIACDLSDPLEVRRSFMEISSKINEIDLFVNCAGMNKMDWFPDVNYSEYQKVMEVNCNTPIFATQLILGNLEKSNGTVLNIISMGAHKPFRTSLAYNVSKAALKMATYQLARELKSTHDITVFGISPNELQGTGMTEDNLPEICRIRGWSEEQAEEYRVKSGGAGQTDPDALARFIHFLLHKKENHKMMNGVDLYYGD